MSHPYIPGGSNSTLDNYFVLHLSNSTDTVSGKFAQVTANGVNFVAIDYSHFRRIPSLWAAPRKLDFTRAPCETPALP